VRWCLLLEEFRPEHCHIAGKDNAVASALSRSDMDMENDEQWDNESIPKDGIAQTAATCMCVLLRDESCNIPSAKDPTAMAECFLNNVAKEKEFSKFPVDPEVFHKNQKKDKNAMHKMKSQATGHGTIVLEGQVLIPKEDKIVVPSVALQEKIVAWCHQRSCHPGQT